MILNTQIWKQMVAAAKTKAAHQPAWVRAIDRAAVEIEKARYWSFADGVLTIESTTSGKLYKVGESHTCEATAQGKPCKHRAARRLMVLYFTALQADAPVTTAPIQRITPCPAGYREKSYVGVRAGVVSINHWC